MIWIPPDCGTEIPKWELMKPEDTVVTIRRRVLHPSQSLIVELLNDDNTFILTAACGRRFGKSRLGLDIMCEAVKRGESVLWTMPKWDNFADLIDEFHAFFGEAIQQSNRKQHLYRMTSGSYIKFAACWNQEATIGRGYDFKVVIMDEAAATTKLEMILEKNIKPSMSVRKKGWGKPKVLIVSSPSGCGDCFEEMYLRGGGKKDEYGVFTGDDGYAAARFASWHNPYVDAGFLEMERKSKSEDAFNQEYGASFLELGGELITSLMFNRVQWDGKGIISVGVDLATENKPDSDYSAFVCTAKHPTGRIFVLGAMRIKEKLPSIILQKLEFFCTTIFSLCGRRVDYVWVERSGTTTGVANFLLANAKNLPIAQSKIPTTMKKDAKIMTVVGKYSTGIMCHPDRHRELEEELMAYPKGRHDDMADALAIAIYEHQPKSVNSAY